MMREGDLLKLVLDYLKLHRIFFRRRNTGAMKVESEDFPGKPRFIRYGKRGDPDIEIWHKGRYFAVELKSDTGKQTQAQKNFESDLTAAGCKYILARSLEDLTKELT